MARGGAHCRQNAWNLLLYPSFPEMVALFNADKGCGMKRARSAEIRVRSETLTVPQQHLFETVRLDW